MPFNNIHGGDVTLTNAGKTATIGFDAAKSVFSSLPLEWAPFSVKILEVQEFQVWQLHSYGHPTQW